MFKIPVTEAAILVAGFMGLVCSSSSLKTSAGDAATAIGGQAGRKITLTARRGSDQIRGQP